MYIHTYTHTHVLVTQIDSPVLYIICAAEVSSIEWDFVNITEDEEDIINRMYRLVGDRYTDP